MSFDTFVQRFRDGAAVPISSAAFGVLRPYIDKVEPEHHFWHVRAIDGGEADVYAAVAPETFESLMISRFSAGVVLDLLAEFARQAGAVILPPGCPVLLTAETQRQDLPAELQHEAVVVRDGQDIEQALRAC